MVSFMLPERSRNSSLGNDEMSGTFSNWLQARSRVWRWGKVGMAGREESWLEWRRRHRSRGLPMIGGNEERELLEKLMYSRHFMWEKNLYKNWRSKFISHAALHLPWYYGRKLLREKTFTNFVMLDKVISRSCRNHWYKWFRTPWKLSPQKYFLPRNLFVIIFLIHCRSYMYCSNDYYTYPAGIPRIWL